MSSSVSLPPADMGLSQARPEQRQTAAAEGKRSPPGDVSPAAGAAKISDAGAQAGYMRTSGEDLREAVEQIATFMYSVDRALEISVDDDLGSTVITIVDRATEEVVRQIPSEEAVAVARFMAERQAMQSSEESPRGLLFDGQG